MPALGGKQRSAPKLQGQQHWPRAGLQSTHPSRTHTSAPLPDRPTHKRHAPPERSNVFHDLPEPQSQQGPTHQPYKEPETMREPGMPRYGRPHGATILRESDQVGR